MVGDNDESMNIKNQSVDRYSYTSACSTHHPDLGMKAIKVFHLKFKRTQLTFYPVKLPTLLLMSLSFLCGSTVTCCNPVAVAW